MFFNDEKEEARLHQSSVQTMLCHSSAVKLREGGTNSNEGCEGSRAGSGAVCGSSEGAVATKAPFSLGKTATKFRSSPVVVVVAFDEVDKENRNNGSCIKFNDNSVIIVDGAFVDSSSVGDPSSGSSASNVTPVLVSSSSSSNSIVDEDEHQHEHALEEQQQQQQQQQLGDTKATSAVSVEAPAVPAVTMPISSDKSIATGHASSIAAPQTSVRAAGAGHSHHEHNQSSLYWLCMPSLDDYLPSCNSDPSMITDEPPETTVAIATAVAPCTTPIDRDYEYNEQPPPQQYQQQEQQQHHHRHILESQEQQQQQLQDNYRVVSPTNNKVELDFAEAFNQGALVPYLINTCFAVMSGRSSSSSTSTHSSPSPHDAGLSRSMAVTTVHMKEYEWNGHRPLDPVPKGHYTYPFLRNKLRSRLPLLLRKKSLEQERLQEEQRRQKLQGNISIITDKAIVDDTNIHPFPLAPKTTATLLLGNDGNTPQTQPNTSVSAASTFFSSTSSSSSSSSSSTSRTSSLLNEEASAPPPPPASKDAASRGMRRAPATSASMSLPPGQQGKLGKQGSETKRGVEKVQVQQPGADRAALKELPALRDAPPAKREELFILKLKLCSVIFSFDDPTTDKRGKDMKRQTLLELVDYVNTPAGQKIFTESVMGDLMAMVSANVCRALPPATDDFDPEEDEPVLEPAWPHLQVAYEFFLRFIVSSEVNAKAAKKYVDQKFCLQLVELFDSEDPRERDYLKTILHRIYGKFMSHRSFIRRAISNVFYRFVYETERHNGIGELLEILGSIINGFAIPLKKEHLQFLVRALIPLHKPKCVALYHQQLSYCIIQYVEKDADTATPILNGFFKCWPWSCSGKQVMFLNELEEILELLGADQLAQVSTMLFTNLARCLDSDHFQVVERALFLWNNEHLVNSGCLSRLNAQAVLPIIYGPLYKNSSGHWNATVEGLAQNVLKMYMEYDLALYDKCTAAYFREEEEAKRKLAAIEDRWSAIEQIASTNQPAIVVK